MTPRILRRIRTSLLFVTCLLVVWMLMFHRRRLNRGSSWQPMASFIIDPNHARGGDDSRESLADEMYADSGRRIPHIIHQTWSGPVIPELFLPWMKSWRHMNPDWQYWFWTDDDILRFFRFKFPEYLDLYQAYPGKGYKADMIRYFILYEYGGVYADIDVESLRPLANYTDTTDCFLSQEPEAHALLLSPLGAPLASNAVMGCRAGHPFFEGVVVGLASRTGLWDWAAVLWATGPYMLTEYYRAYSMGGLLGAYRPPVSLAEADAFQPSLDSSMVDYMRQLCVSLTGNMQVSDSLRMRQDRVCERVIGNDFRQRAPPEAYTNHYWTHTWAGRRNDPYSVMDDKRTFNVRDLNP